MKNIAGLFAFILIIVCCKKNNSIPTTQDILVNHKWYFKSFLVNNKIDSAGTACGQNCYLTFSKTGGVKVNGGTGTAHYENSVCTTYPPFQFKYYFEASGSSTSAYGAISCTDFYKPDSANIVYTPYTVVTLNDSVFDITWQYIDFFEYKFIAH